MAFPRIFLEQIKSRISVSEVVGRKVRLTRRGREYVGLSPFKQERTPSFTVNDTKQFYHCFASGKHGNIFDFVMETEGLNFLEAVARFARELGMEMPKRDAQDAKRGQQQKQLSDINELAVRWFQEQLNKTQGVGARDYLHSRNIAPALAEGFGIGFAPAGRRGLTEYLRARDVPAASIVAAGLAIKPDDGGALYDRFRNRLMFPIHDLQSRTIAFGGRALDSHARAKYLNSPETELFHKGRVLYNMARARAPAYESKQLLVVEGYMDVVGLARGGINHAVAPLGTAITEEQIALMWRLTPEPILCMDGDNAGRLAAYRVISRVLPILKPGYSLRFAMLPQGKDPDDIVAQEGAASLYALLEKTITLDAMLWAREKDSAPYATPEQKADLRQRLMQAVGQIENPEIRQYYKQSMNECLYELFRKVQPRRAYRSKNQYEHENIISPRSVTRHSPVATGMVSMPRNEALILGGVINHPEFLDTHLDDFETLTLTNALSELRFAIIDIYEASSSSKKLDKNALIGHLQAFGQGEMTLRLMGVLRNEPPAFLKPPPEHAQHEDATTVPKTGMATENQQEDFITAWLEIVNLHTHMVLKRECEKAANEYKQSLNAGDYERFVALKSQL